MRAKYSEKDVSTEKRSGMVWVLMHWLSVAVCRKSEPEYQRDRDTLTVRT